MKGKDIIVVADVITNGGAERVLSILMSEWAKHNSVTLIVCNEDLLPDEYALNKAIKRISITSRFKNRVLRYSSLIFQLIPLLKEQKGAVAMAFQSPAMRLLSFASIFVPNKTIVSQRIDPEREFTRIRLKAERFCYLKMADCCVFQTEEARNYFPESIRKKSDIIPNPINPDLPDAYEGTRRKTIVAACRLVPQKNVPMLLKAFAKFINEHPDYTLEIYGRSVGKLVEEENKIRRLIQELGLENKALLMGFSQNIYECMRDCAMYVSSSNYEGISNSIMEALGMGIPTIATDCPAGGSRMLIRDGENGLLIPVGDVDALYQAMKRIAENPEFARKLSSNAMKVRDEYKAETIAAKWLEIM